MPNFSILSNDPITRKLDRRVLPFFIILEISSYMNQTSIGCAKIMGIQKDLRISDSEMNWATSVFFFLYLIFAVPSNLFMHRLGPTAYLSLAMIAWGSVSVGLAFAGNAQVLIAIRALLAVTESGYFPSIIIYTSWWYCQEEQTMRIVILCAAGIASSAIGNILAYGFTFMRGFGGLMDWQFMFLLENALIIPLGVITWFFLEKIVNAVQWLEPIEQQTLTNRLQQDTGADNDELDLNAKHQWRKAFDIFADWRIYLYAIINMGNLAVFKYLTVCLPSIIERMGYDQAKILLMAPPPFVIACIFCLLMGYSSSRWNEHAYHLVSCELVALLGFILMITLGHWNAVEYIGICIACAGALSTLPLLLSWLIKNVRGLRKRSLAIASVLGIGQTGVIILPLVDNNHNPNNRSGFFICIGLLTASLIVTLLLRLCLKLANNRRLATKLGDVVFIRF